MGSPERTDIRTDWTQEALSRFTAAGMDIFRTDQQGSITFSIS